MWAFYSRVAPVQIFKGPTEFEVIIGNSYGINEIQEKIFRLCGPILTNKSICKRVFMSFEFDKIILIYAPIHYFVTILHVKKGFFVHMQNPWIFVGFWGLRSLVKGTSFEKSI